MPIPYRQKYGILMKRLIYIMIECVSLIVGRSTTSNDNYVSILTICEILGFVESRSEI